jgi:cyclopropane-fatty-acyl-phospholipid synthase
MNKKDIIDTLIRNTGIRVVTDSLVILPTDIKLGQNHETEFYTRLYENPLLSLGEMYMEEIWSCNDLVQLIKLFFDAGLNNLRESPKEIKYRFFLKMIPYFIKTRILNSAKKNPYEIGQKHYDIGNDLYQVMLDSSMTYSCGLWSPDIDNLEEAQKAKFKRICEDLQFKPGMRVLDIGCGFGSFAKYAAIKYGVEVIGITVSKEQAIFARENCKGLAVTILVQDYRLLVGCEFDAIVSIGMFEHVHKKNYKEFFKICARLLKPGGKLFLHTIASFQKVLVTDPFINKWIFPNSYIPTEKQTLKPALRFFNRLQMYYIEPENYARTLEVWYKNFKNGWDSIKQNYQNFGYSFYRKWEFYLCCCIATFKAEKKYVLQILFEKK